MSSHNTPFSAATDPALQRAAQVVQAGTQAEQQVAHLPTGTWRMLAHRRLAPRALKGLDAGYDRLVAWLVPVKPRRKLALNSADAVLMLEEKYAAMSDDVLRETLGTVRESFRRGRETKEQIVQAFAMVREAAFRTLGMKPYRVQVAGAVAMTRGCLIEMATGEGKTLVASMPAIVAGWRGRGCHVLTVNDYLAARDARELKPLYRFCGVSVGHVDGSMQPHERRAGYHADVTYCTNKEVAADYLRDRLALGGVRNLTDALLEQIVAKPGAPAVTDQLVMRGLETAIIDEADSILVDEGVTPLIISAEGGDPVQQAAYPVAAKFADALEEASHYDVVPKYREVNLTTSGRKALSELVAQHVGDLPAYFKGSRLREELVTQALTARHLFLRDQQYVIQNGKIVIVDESTGRLMPDRSWRAGLHQAVEAKEILEGSEVEMTAPKDTLARISFQRFFRLYRHLSGMSGTLMEERRELWQIYRTPTVPIPTHRPLIRKQAPVRVFTHAGAKWDAVVEEVAKVHATGRPVLVGTRNVEDSELLSGMLVEKGLEHQVLNAVRHAEEAAIVAESGQRGRITVATNMAGRGTDIRLEDGVCELGGLHVIATDRHDNARVDRQLAGRAGRQGDPGSACAFASLEDELVRRHAKGSVPKADAKVREVNAAKVLDKAQTRAQRLARVQRAGVLRSDDWLDEYLGFAGREH